MYTEIDKKTLDNIAKMKKNSLRDEDSAIEYLIPLIYFEYFKRDD